MLHIVVQCYCRWIYDGEVKESFIGMNHINDTTANGITTSLRSILVRIGLDIQQCGGQCYDGACVMRGAINGVATQILAVSIYM